MPQSDIVKDKQRLLAILKKDSFFKEKITLSSGKESDFYIDARRVTLKPEGAYLCAKVILEMVKKEKIDAIGGPTMGADPIVGAIAAVSFQAGRPMNTFIVRKAPKPHGKQQQIEGPLIPENGRVIMVDDVATTGKAFVQAMDVLTAMGVKPQKAICLVDRNEGAKEILKERGCELVSIFTINDFLK